MNTEPKEHCTNHFTDGSKIFPNRDCCTPPTRDTELRAALAECVEVLDAAEGYIGAINMPGGNALLPILSAALTRATAILKGDQSHE